jgi:hypothetical protein
MGAASCRGFPRSPPTRPMKVPPGEKHDEATRPRPAASFQQALRAVPRPGAATASALAGLRCRLVQATCAPPGRTAPGSSEGLRLVRQGLHAEAQRLGEVRVELSGRSEQRHEQRAMELIARELSRELTREPAPPSPAIVRSEPPAPASDAARAGSEEAKVEGARARGEGVQVAAPAALRAEAALALIERIELFMRSQRPAMALSVRGTLEATVEVERTGPREVALRIQGHQGPPPAQELAQLRAALEARGLQLRSLQVC